MDAIRREMAGMVLTRIAASIPTSVQTLTQSRGTRTELREGRRVAAFILCRHLGLSPVEAAEVLGNRQVATIQVYVTAMERRAALIPGFADESLKRATAVKREIRQRYPSPATA
jgi:hypothetical protein